MTTIINRSVPVVALGILLSSFSAQAVTLPPPGDYVDQEGGCISVTERNRTERTFTLNTGDVCKPGIAVGDGEGEAVEERTYRCVTGGAGFWGRLTKGDFSIQGDTTFVFDEAGLLVTQQTLRFPETVTFTRDTTGVCSGAPVSAAARGR